VLRTVLLWGQIVVSDNHATYPEHATLAPDWETTTLGPKSWVEVGDFAGGFYGDLPALLGLAPIELPIGTVVAFEDNGGSPASGGGWESSHWTFSDGTNTLYVPFNETSGAPNPRAVVKTGSLTAAEYAAFFGLDPGETVAEVISYVVFRLPPRIDVGSPSFTIHVMGGNDIGGEGSPDPDAIAIVGGIRAPR
jgi:hypothetical protein